jgi:hypothetical protein
VLLCERAAGGVGVDGNDAREESEGRGDSAEPDLTCERCSAGSQSARRCR